MGGETEGGEHPNTQTTNNLVKLAPCPYDRCSSPSKAVSAVSDIRKDFPIHLELASMTDKDYMNRIMQEVRVKSRPVESRNSQEFASLMKVFRPVSC